MNLQDKTLADISAAVRAIQAHIIEIKRGKLSDALRFYKDTKDEYNRLDALRKELNEALESLSRNGLPEMMADEGVRTVTLDDIGYRFTVSHRYSCSMVNKDTVKGINWLKENGHGDLVIETVNSSTLASFAKSQLEESGEELPTDIFKTSLMAYTSVTKANVRA